MSTLHVNHRRSPLRWLHQQLLGAKLASPLGFLLILAAAGVMGLAFALLPLKLALIGTGVLVGIPVVIAAFLNLQIGISLALILAFSIDWLKKMADVPIGLALDGILVLLLLSLLLRLIKNRDTAVFKNPITWLVLAWIYFNVAQVLNPWAGSRMAWAYTVRTVALLQALFFIGTYAFSSLARIKTMLKLIIGLSFAAALYGLKQEFVGFSATELAWLHADEKRFQLIFQWSRLRIFGPFSDPTTYGILMGYMGTACLLLATYGLAWWKRLLCGVAGVAMMMSMAYAGSRTPFVLIPLGFLFYVLLTFRKSTLIGLAGFALIGFVLVAKSTSNPVIYRIQSAFKPGDDASVQVRLDNQALIQPFIQSHPVGAGLGSTGAWGKRFTPDSWLASFAHDSLYVRLATETGWIGLLLYMALLFAVFREGVRNYFRCRDDTVKMLYLILTTCVLLLMVASYPQEAITLLPNSIIFYLMSAMIVRLKTFDSAGEEGDEVMRSAYGHS